METARCDPDSITEYKETSMVMNTETRMEGKSRHQLKVITSKSQGYLQEIMEHMGTNVPGILEKNKACFKANDVSELGTRRQQQLTSVVGSTLNAMAKLIAPEKSSNSHCHNRDACRKKEGKIDQTIKLIKQDLIKPCPPIECTTVCYVYEAAKAAFSWRSDSSTVVPDSDLWWLWFYILRRRNSSNLSI